MVIHPWRECEIELTAAGAYPTPYTDVDVWAEFRHEFRTDDSPSGLLGWRTDVARAVCLAAC